MTYEESLKLVNDIIRFIEYCENPFLQQKFHSAKTNESKLYFSRNKNEIDGVNYKHYEVMRKLMFSPSIVISESALWYTPSRVETIYDDYYDVRSAALSEEMYFQFQCTLDDSDLIGIMVFSHLYQKDIPYNFHMDLGFLPEALELFDKALGEKCD